MRCCILFLVLFMQLQLMHGQRTLFSQKYDSMAEDFNLSPEEIEAYKAQGKLEVFNEIKQKTPLTNTLIEAKVGKSIKFDRGYYKGKYEVVAKSEVPHYRVRYIFINKNKFEDEGEFEAYLNKVRALISKTEFKSVAMQYSMDYKKGVGGDSGWFKQGQTNPDFFQAVTRASLLADQVFEFEIPERNWYYVAKKTHSQKNIREVLVVQIRQE